MFSSREKQRDRWFTESVKNYIEKLFAGLISKQKNKKQVTLSPLSHLIGARAVMVRVGYMLSGPSVYFLAINYVTRL